jgi:uncharacterized LabA/DUF88 family protein
MIRGVLKPWALFYLLKVGNIMPKTAILVDGGFYRKRATYLWGKKTAQQRATELSAYCNEHIKSEKTFNQNALYRIFYYDCPPLSKNVFHPLFNRTIDFGKTDTYNWTIEFFEALKQKRKFALRLGKLSDDRASFELKPDTLKKIFSKKISLEDLTEDDFEITFSQKGVDMKIGIDIASLAFKQQVDQIILIAGDSDFVPAAKLARREGIDFVLDPMWSEIKPDLFEHIDGLNSKWGKKQTSIKKDFSTNKMEVKKENINK